MSTKMAAFRILGYSPTYKKPSNSYDPNKKSLNNISINNGTFTKCSSIKVDLASKLTSVDSVTENGYKSEQHIQHNILIINESVAHFSQENIEGSEEGGARYRERVVIRSYEVGPDKIATLEGIRNLLQETAMNHMWFAGLTSNEEFGATHGMMKNDLIWHLSSMPLFQVDHYPTWGEQVEIETWIDASSKNGMRRDWLIRSIDTGHVYARATGIWVMKNRITRRLSKMPEEVRAEIASWFKEKQVFTQDVLEETVKFDNKAKYMNKDLKPKRSDFDMSQHVNNVKYVNWMLETIPDQILEANQLTSIVLEYIRECGCSSIVQSHFQPDEDGILKDRFNQEKYTTTSLLNGFSMPPSIESTAIRIILILEEIFRALPGVVRLLILLVFHIRKFM